MKYFIHLSYSGANYRGWQRQPNAPSVQETLEDALSKMLREKILCSSCSRTDALVHASQFFAHIKTEKELNPDHIFIINKMLPDDIVVYDFIPVHREAHAQNDVISRSYDYFIHSNPNPFISNFSSYYDLANFDLETVKKVCELIREQSDFRSLCREPEKYKSTICDIHELSFWADENESRFCFSISADRFLRSMVRQIVGHIILIGKGEMKLKDFKTKLEVGSTIDPGISAYPQGLFLSDVRYEYISTNIGQNNFSLLKSGMNPK